MVWSQDLKNRLGGITPAKPTRPGLTSVLVMIGPHAETGRDEILLMKRTMTVETHKGQISFPGGFWEPQDASLLQTALRETDEEIGVKADEIEVLGALEPVRTRGDILIYPWVARFAFPYPFVLNPAEVERLLFLPVSRLVAEGLQKVSVKVGDYDVQSVGISVDGELVWGATARMLEELHRHFVAFTKTG